MIAQKAVMEIIRKVGGDVRGNTGGQIPGHLRTSGRRSRHTEFIPGKGTAYVDLVRSGALHFIVAVSRVEMPLDPKSWSRRTTPKLSFQMIGMLALNSCTFKWSQRLKPLQDDVVEAGMNAHKACMVGLIPKFKGSHAPVGLAMVVHAVVIGPLAGLKLYGVGTPSRAPVLPLRHCVPSGLDLSTDGHNRRRPCFIWADGTAFVTVTELGKRNPS